MYVAYQLAKTLYKPALKEVTVLLALRAERFFQVNIALKLIEDLNDPALEELVKRRMTNIGLLKKPDGWKEAESKLLLEGVN